MSSAPSSSTVSAVDSLNRLATSYNTVVQKKQLKVTDVYVQSISNPETAFQKPSGVLGWVKYFFVKILHHETLFQVDGTELRVNLYDKTSNIRGIHTLFERALNPIRAFQPSCDSKTLRTIVNFALTADKMLPVTLSSGGDTSQKILEKFLSKNGRGLDRPAAETRDGSIGQTLLGSARVLADQNNLNFLKLTRLFIAVQGDLSGEEKNELVDVLSGEMRKKSLEERNVAWNEVFEVVDGLKEPLSKEVFSMIAGLVCKEAKDLATPADIFQSWTLSMKRLKDHRLPIPFDRKTFHPIVLQLGEAWKRAFLGQIEGLDRIDDSHIPEKMQQLSGLLQKAVLEHQKLINGVKEQFSWESGEDLEEVLNVTEEGAVVQAFQKIISGHLNQVIQRVGGLKSRDELESIQTNLYSFQQQMNACFSGAIADEGIRTRYNHQSEAIEIVLRQIGDKLGKLLPPQPVARGLTSVLSGNKLSIVINGVACQAMNVVAMSAAVAMGPPFNVLGVVSSIGMSVAAPLLIKAGSAAWTPVSAFVDHQCDRLPSPVKTPMKYAWRMAGAAGALYVSYRAYQGLFSKTVVPITPPPQTVPQPAAPSGEVVAQPAPTGPNATVISTNVSASAPIPEASFGSGVPSMVATKASEGFWSRISNAFSRGRAHGGGFLGGGANQFPIPSASALLTGTAGSMPVAVPPLSPGQPAESMVEAGGLGGRTVTPIKISLKHEGANDVE